MSTRGEINTGPSGEVLTILSVRIEVIILSGKKTQRQ